MAIVSAVAAASIGYYAYQAQASDLATDSAVSLGGGLHRSNAIRGSRRRPRTEASSSSSSEAPGDENVEGHDAPADAPAADAETVAENGGDEWWNDASGFPPSQRAGHNIVNLLFRVSEDNARRNGCVHRGCQCNACGMVPIRGVRYRCANCADFDLCETCESQDIHIKTHIFYKIRVPAPPFGPRQMQPVWYTGDPETCRRNLPRGLIAKLSRDTGFERPELEAFWEQWTYMANTEWRDDPDELCVAMDRKTFERCLVPTGGSRHANPNLIHDRMFSFYDSNNDDLIGFSEFLHGLSYRKRKDKLRKVFEGYDIDGDGYVNRRDFLRMFRAYYVLYKQMHKDILDGLEDQLLASTEAQQLVASRQPLSSLFGREGRVPAADGNPTFEGKTYHANGDVEVTGDKRAVAGNHKDRAKREDILTSLFACETDQRSRRRFVTGSDTDTNWRTVRRLSGTEADRTYWVTLLEPPTTLEELPDILMGTNPHEADETEDDDADGDDDDEDGDGDGGGDGSRNAADTYEASNGHRTDSDLDPFAAGRVPTESEIRSTYIAHMHRQGPKMEKRRRDMARKQLHDRWKRRQFYLDEEEGGRAPGDWEDDEDILANLIGAESSKTSFERPNSAHSDESDAWVHWGLSQAEGDAGREILYQVTQQAFNELLDTIFKPAEDFALEAAETKAQRERFKDAIDAVEATDDNIGKDASPRGSPIDPITAIDDKTLDELLLETGYTIATPEPRNAVELDVTVEVLHDEDLDSLPPDVDDGNDEEEEEEAAEHRDPTMPQFRPNSGVSAVNPTNGFRSPKFKAASSTDKAENNLSSKEAVATETSEPTVEMLRKWKTLSEAEAKAAARGGWGRLSFEEFEEIYKSQEHQGNRLDYLGSWIDFCIP